MGFVILIDNASPAPLDDLAMYLDIFKPYLEQAAAVIAITRTDTSSQPDIDAYYQFLQDHGAMYPIITADVPRKEDILVLLDNPSVIP